MQIIAVPPSYPRCPKEFRYIDPCPAFRAGQVIPMPPPAKTHSFVPMAAFVIAFVLAVVAGSALVWQCVLLDNEHKATLDAIADERAHMYRAELVSDKLKAVEARLCEQLGLPAPKQETRDATDDR